jgi:hypothetical protein
MVLLYNALPKELTIPAWHVSKLWKNMYSALRASAQNEFELEYLGKYNDDFETAL